MAGDIGEKRVYFLAGVMARATPTKTHANFLRAVMFAELAGAIEKLPKRDWEENAWIRPGTWAAVDERGAKKNAGTLTRREGRKLTRRIKRLLDEDRVERARRAGEKAVLLRAEGKEKEAWAVVKG